MICQHYDLCILLVFHVYGFVCELSEQNWATNLRPSYECSAEFVCDLRKNRAGLPRQSYDCNAGFVCD